MSRYAWIIDRDHLYPIYAGPEMRDEAGTIGPHDATAELVAQLTRGHGRTFRMYDDDGECYYTGRLLTVTPSEIDDYELAPLDDFGTPNAGCTRITFTPQQPTLPPTALIAPPAAQPTHSSPAR